MIDSIISEVLRDASDIEIVRPNETKPVEDYDVLVLNSLDDQPGGNGYNSPSPSSGIVMVTNEGLSAMVYRRMGEEVSLEQSAPIALKDSITLAARQS